MPLKGTWGDKTIFVLSSQDKIHTHKHWCVYYFKEDNYCSFKMTKCFGSAHCEHYKKKHINNNDSKFVNPNTKPNNPQTNKSSLDNCQSTKKEEKAIKTKTMADYIPGHNPSFGEKLLNKLVIIKKLSGVEFGIVISENHDYITIKKDSGVVCKYERKTVIRQKVLWVVDS